MARSAYRPQEWLPRASIHRTRQGVFWESGSVKDPSGFELKSEPPKCTLYMITAFTIPDLRVADNSIRKTPRRYSRSYRERSLIGGMRVAPPSGAWERNGSPKCLGAPNFASDHGKCTSPSARLVIQCEALASC